MSHDISIDIKEIEVLKKDLESMKTEQAKTEATLEQLEKRRAEIISEIESLGVKYEDAEATLTSLRQEIQANIDKAKTIISEYKEAISEEVKTTYGN